DRVPGVDRDRYLPRGQPARLDAVADVGQGPVAIPPKDAQDQIPAGGVDARHGGRQRPTLADLPLEPVLIEDAVGLQVDGEAVERRGRGRREGAEVRGRVGGVVRFEDIAVGDDGPAAATTPPPARPPAAARAPPPPPGARAAPGGPRWPARGAPGGVAAAVGAREAAGGGGEVGGPGVPRKEEGPRPELHGQPEVATGPADV